jgi:hypothetical protein
MIPGWIDAIDAEVRASMCARDGFTPAELAAALGVGESCAARYILLLADAGRLRIAAAAWPPATAGATAPAAPLGRAA